jgi:hypothetical protein
MGFDPISMGLTAVGALAGGLSQKSANKKADAERNRLQGIVDSDARKYEDYQRMLESALGGNPAIFGPQTTTSSGSSSGMSTTDSESMPVISAEFAPLVAQFRKVMEDRLTRGSSLPPGYRAQQERNVNAAYAPQEANLRNIAARRGVSADSLLVGSPIESAKASKYADIAASLPLLERQMQNEDVAQSAGIASTFGRGEKSHSTTRSSQNSNQSTTSPASASALMNYYSMLAPRPTQIVQAGEKGSPLAAALTGASTGYGFADMFRRPPKPNNGAGVYGI